MRLVSNRIKERPKHDDFECYPQCNGHYPLEDDKPESYMKIHTNLAAVLKWIIEV